MYTVEVRVRSKPCIELSPTRRSLLVFLITALFFPYGCKNTLDAPAEVVDPNVLAGARQNQPEFSHDGQYIVFVGDYDSLNAVHIIDKDGKYIGTF